MIIYLLGIWLFVLAFFYIAKIHLLNRSYRNDYGITNNVCLRKFPYPYKSALTICSDIDNTNTVDMFLDIQKFINTKTYTSMGKGIGLEIGNSFFMFNKKFGYFSDNERDKETISRLINIGIIDCMHSFGDKDDFSREDAVLSLMELNKLDKRLDVWTDHSNRVYNIGGDITGGKGDTKGSMVYHSDLITEYGFKFFWLGRITNVVGQDVPIKIGTFTGVYDADFKFRSMVNMTKEFLKHLAGIFGNMKYAMHKDYRLVRIRTLCDGKRVFEFMRFDGHWEGVGKGANSKGLAYNLSPKNFRRLIQKNGYMIIYTHLGKNSDCDQIVAKETQLSLRLLEEEYRKGNIYVTTTSRLLNYYITKKYLQWKAAEKEGSTVITIASIYDPLNDKYFEPDPLQLQGITFYVSDPETTRLYVGINEVKDIIINPPDDTGRKSIMFPVHTQVSSTFAWDTLVS